MYIYISFYYFRCFWKFRH